MAPLWLAQQKAWGEAGQLLANITKPASCISERILQGTVLMPASASLPLTRLLLSCAATELKVARVAGLQPGSWILRFMESAFLRDSGVASSAAVFALLLPRLASAVPTGSSRFSCDAFMSSSHIYTRTISGLSGLLFQTSCHMSVLLSRAVAEMANFSQATRPHAHSTVQLLVGYATCIVRPTLRIVQLGRLPPAVRARLALPFLMLLQSPLLGFLASLQHVVIESSTDINCWQFPESSGIPPVHLLPASMQPDALDSEVATQVSHSLFFYGLLLPAYYQWLDMTYLPWGLLHSLYHHA